MTINYIQNLSINFSNNFNFFSFISRCCSMKAASLFFRSSISSLKSCVASSIEDGALLRFFFASGIVPAGLVSLDLVLEMGVAMGMGMTAGIGAEIEADLELELALGVGMELALELELELVLELELALGAGMELALELELELVLELGVELVLELLENVSPPTPTSTLIGVNIGRSAPTISLI